MARSSYIYIVRRKRDRTIVNGWTVKHELTSWLERTKESWQKRGMSLANMVNVYEVFQMRDGNSATGFVRPLPDFIDLPSFSTHLEEASETVRGWPGWKQNVLGEMT